MLQQLPSQAIFVEIDRTSTGPSLGDSSDAFSGDSLHNLNPIEKFISRAFTLIPNLCILDIWTLDSDIIISKQSYVFVRLLYCQMLRVTLT